MIAAFCTQPGVFDLREIAQPEPGPAEVLVRVHSCGICGSDLHFYHGAVTTPRVCPGHEIAGEVALVGKEVTRVSGGDRVAIEPLTVCRECAYCRSGEYQLCRAARIAGLTRDGGFAEYVMVPAYAVYPLPANVDCELGALTEPLAVGVHAVRLAALRLGERVLVLGAGTIGLLAVAAARAAGAEVWIIARYPQQARAATILGARRVFAGGDAMSELSSASADQSLDAVIETIGGAADTINDAIHLVRPGGRVAVLGVFTKSPPLNALKLMSKEIRLFGSLTYGRSGHHSDFDVALQLLSSQPGLFRPLLTQRFPLHEIGRAFEAASDKGSGAIKVTIAP